MPWAAKKPCGKPGCGALVSSKDRFCEQHRRQTWREEARARREAGRAHRHLYNSARWKQGRLAHLAVQPLCVLCKQAGRVTAATVVDHVRPHRGDEALFFDPNNWQSVCKPCHDGAKQQVEKQGGLMRGCDANGIPLDPSHPWRKAQGPGG